MAKSEKFKALSNEELELLSNEEKKEYKIRLKEYKKSLKPKKKIKKYNSELYFFIYAFLIRLLFLLIV